MTTVKQELINLNEGWDELTSVLEGSNQFSSDLLKEVQSFHASIEYAVANSHYHTEEMLDQLREESRRLSHEISTVLATIGALHHRGQLIQADAVRSIADSIGASAWTKGVLGIAAAAVAGGFAAWAISDSSKSKRKAAEKKRLSEEEIKLISVYERVKELCTGSGQVTEEEVVNSLSNETDGILKRKEARRYLSVLKAKGVLEKQSDAGPADGQTLLGVKELQCDDLLKVLRG